MLLNYVTNVFGSHAKLFWILVPKIEIVTYVFYEVFHNHKIYFIFHDVFYILNQNFSFLVNIVCYPIKEMNIVLP